MFLNTNDDLTREDNEDNFKISKLKHQTLEMVQEDKRKNTSNTPHDIEAVDDSQFASKPPNLVKSRLPTWKENLSYYFSQYCSATSIHGVQYIGERGRFITEKIFWTIIVTIVWCLCLMLIVKTYNKWISSPVIVNFAATETPISSIPFPAVTICPAIKTDPSVFNFSDVMIRKLSRMKVLPEENDKFEAFSLVCAGFDELLSGDGVTENLNMTVSDDVVHYLTEGFPHLDNFSQTIWLGETITVGNLSEIFSSEGLCYSFNMLDYSEIYKDSELRGYIVNRSIAGMKHHGWSLDGGYPDRETLDSFPRRTFVSGKNGGFQAILYTNHSKLDYMCGELLQSFKVTLHHPCETPNMDRNFLVPLDQVVLVAIKPRMTVISEELMSYSPEDRKCYLTDEKHLALFKIYTQHNCLDECLSNYTFVKCGCVPFYMPKVAAFPICGYGSKKCVDESKVNYLSNYESNCNCLPSCTALAYDVEISQSNWNWRDFFKVLNNTHPIFQKNFQHDMDHFSMVAVYYKEMQFLTSERHQLSGYLDFFANIGGLLGLFIGFSVTSLIEILYFLTFRLACNIRRFGQRFWSGEPSLINAKEDH